MFFSIRVVRGFSRQVRELVDADNQRESTLRRNGLHPLRRFVVPGAQYRSQQPDAGRRNTPNVNFIFISLSVYSNTTRRQRKRRKKSRRKKFAK